MSATNTIQTMPVPFETMYLWSGYGTNVVSVGTALWITVTVEVVLSSGLEVCGVADV